MKDQTLKVKVGNLASGGNFVCINHDNPNSKKIFTRFVAPTEIANVVITKEEPSLLFAELESIASPAQTRIDPKCRFFTVCGGCDLQHLEILQQRALKLEMVKSSFERHLKIEPRSGYDLLGAELPAFNYRKRMSYHLDNSGNLGLYKRSSLQVIDIDNCPIASQAINQKFSEIKDDLIKTAGLVETVIIDELEGECFVKLKISKNAKDIRINKELQHLIKSHNNISYQIENAKTKADTTLPVGHFSQVNKDANSLLVQAVVNSIPSNCNVTEFYAGSGNFSFDLANISKSIIAVELDPQLVKYAQKKSANLNIKNLQLICSSTEKYIEKTPLTECIVLDPPRQGAKYLAQQIKSEITKHISYVSCDLATLTRDLKIIISSGFKLDKVSVLDMFPQTAHVEVLCTLKA